MRRGPQKKVTNDSPVFIDRSDAGRRLAQLLLPYQGPDTVVYAIANGGAVVGYEVARALQAPLELVVPGVIMHPLSPSFAVCAVTEHGERVCDEAGICALEPSWIEHETKHQLQRIQHRREFLGSALKENIHEKTVVLVDDGMVTGLPLKAAILTLKQYAPQRIIAAVPSGPPEVAERIRPLVEEVIVLAPDHGYRGVTKAYYQHFPVVRDAEVRTLYVRIQKECAQKDL